MKVKYSVVQERRNNIMILLQKLGKIDVDTLAYEFNVSAITIRRDLQNWEDLGAVARFHGGAKLVQSMVDLENDNMTNEKYKHAIAKFAAQYIEDGDTIFINTSSTALLVIQYIVNKRVVAVTNNAKALLLKYDPLISIVLTGGEVRNPKESLVGDFAISAIKKVSANKCFLGCSGITSKDGLTTSIMQESSINEAMMDRTTGPKFILCDYTKVGNKHSFSYGNVRDIDYLITDINADDEELDNIKDMNVEVVKLKPLMQI